MLSKIVYNSAFFTKYKFFVQSGNIFVCLSQKFSEYKYFKKTCTISAIGRKKRIVTYERKRSKYQILPMTLPQYNYTSIEKTRIINHVLGGISPIFLLLRKDLNCTLSKLRDEIHISIFGHTHIRVTLCVKLLSYDESNATSGE